MTIMTAPTDLDLDDGDDLRPSRGVCAGIVICTAFWIAGVALVCLL